jgi:ABC-type Fe3+-siderophore transport system permease subunit
MFGSLLILAASILFLIKTTENPTAEITARETSAEASSPEAEHKYIRYALWSASVTLALVISCMTSIALLNRPLDKPKTLLVNSRWVRLTPRIPGMAAIMCLPLFKSVTGAGTWCGAAVVTLYIIFFWEWVAGLERDFKFFEGKDE